MIDVKYKIRTISSKHTRTIYNKIVDVKTYDKGFVMNGNTDGFSIDELKEKFGDDTLEQILNGRHDKYEIKAYSEDLDEVFSNMKKFTIAQFFKKKHIITENFQFGLSIDDRKGLPKEGDNTQFYDDGIDFVIKVMVRDEERTILTTRWGSKEDVINITIDKIMRHFEYNNPYRTEIDEVG